MTLREQFARTTCDCRKCVAACKFMPGSLVPGDLELLCPSGLSPEESDRWLQAHFQASDGAKVLRQGVPMQIPTIVPKLTATGCVFLQAGKCTVHDRAPWGCAFVDMHMGAEESDLRVRAGLIEIIKDGQANGPYRQAWQRLHATGNQAPSLEFRRNILSAAIADIEREEQNAAIPPTD